MRDKTTKKLKTIREEKIESLVTRRAISITRMLNLAKSSRNKWETAVSHTASIDFVCRIAIALGVKPEYLIDDEIDIDEVSMYLLGNERFSFNRGYISYDNIDTFKLSLSAEINRCCDVGMRNRGVFIDDIRFFDKTVPTGILIAASCVMNKKVSDAFNYSTRVVTLA